MGIESILERAEAHLRKEDERDLSNDSTRIGQGVNTSVHLNQHGQILKSRPYQPGSSESPEKQAEKLQGLDRVPQLELKERDVEGPFEYVMVKMDRGLKHQEAVEVYGLGLEEVVSRDLDMLLELKNGVGEGEGIIYEDFKPGNIGYFPDGGGPILRFHWSDLPDRGDLPDWDSVVAKPIDVIDGGWRHGELKSGELARLINVYIDGTPGKNDSVKQEYGVADLYAVSVEEAESAVLNYFGLDSEVTGDSYMDMMRAFENNRDQMEDILSY